MVTIKYANKDDINILYDLISAIAKHHKQEQYVLTTKDELLNSGFQENPKFGVLLAYFEEKVAGYVSFTWNYSIWSGEQFMNIDDVFVWQEFRGQKIGEALMNRTKEICQEKGIAKIRWEVQSDNFAAINFYERLGAKMTTKGIFNWAL